MVYMIGFKRRWRCAHSAVLRAVMSGLLSCGALMVGGVRSLELMGMDSERVFRMWTHYATILERSAVAVASKSFRKPHPSGKVYI